ncbi:MAG TPA: molecular chaperone DnaJ [Alphaproteobacteria bacterium]|nr:molecular chaperone DnaJ [Alphaproteobacteria bacterium]
MVLFYFLVGVVLLALLWQVLRWFAEANPRQLVRAGQVALAVAAGAVALWFVATGKAADALVLASTVAPFFVRWKALWTRMRNAAGPAPGGSSDVETGWLRMSLDHASGTMDGTVLRGAYQGRRLGQLSLAELRKLAAECRGDADSSALLETYLDRLHPGWREGEAAQEAPAASSAAMSPEEAWRVLGLAPGAGEAAIREAHRRLMKKLHPDQGGSDYLAAKINQAKDLLLGG